MMYTPGANYKLAEGFQFISDIRSMDELINQYPIQDVIPYLRKLNQKYPYYRPVSGDGNCFYRSIAFLYLRQGNLNSFRNVFQNIQDLCEDKQLFYENTTSFQNELEAIYSQTLRPLKNIQPHDRQIRLAMLFNQNYTFDRLMVHYFRSLNVIHIHKNFQYFKSFMDEVDKIISTMRTYGCDSQGVQYQSMAQALGVTIIIHNADRNDCSDITYNQGKPQIYDLFRRPGHFDVAYYKYSPYLQHSNYRNRLTYQTNPRSSSFRHSNQYNNRTSAFNQLQQPSRQINNLQAQRKSSFTNLRTFNQNKPFQQRNTNKFTTPQNNQYINPQNVPTVRQFNAQSFRAQPSYQMKNDRKMDQYQPIKPKIEQKTFSFRNSLDSLRWKQKPKQENAFQNKPRVSVDSYNAWKSSQMTPSDTTCGQVLGMMVILSVVGLLIYYMFFM